MNSTQSHIYSALNPTAHEIRVLALHHGSFSSALAGSLVVTTLTEPVSYEALSYTWGTQGSSCFILINRIELKITANLEIALRHLRRQDKDRLLWIDAICINQAKDATGERNDQVQKMRIIYEKAKRVIAWLGPVEEGGELIVGLVKHLKSSQISQEAVEASLRNPTELPRWKALFGICGRDYWSRVWILQEIACASTVTLKFGNFEIEWEDIGWIGRRFVDDPGTPLLPPELQDTRLSRVSARRSLQILVMEDKQPPLLDLLNMVRRYNCTEPRDRVFGVLGMSKDARDGGFAIDYGLPTADIFLRTAQFVIKNSGKLNVICAKEVKPNPYGHPIWAPSELNLPSWVPDWCIKPGINVIGAVSRGYRAAGESKASPVYSSDGRTITVEGCHLGDIEVIGETYFERHSDGRFSTEMKKIITSWLVLALNGNSPISGGALIETWEEERINAFWRTTLGNRIQNDRPIDEEWYRSMFDVARGASPMPTESTGDAEDAFQKFIRPIADEWRNTIFNRRFYTSGHAIMGLCSNTSRVGDSIVILAGCDIPVILRKNDGDTWEFHGESYVHRFMDGEVADLLVAGKLRLKSFALQ